MTAPSARGLFRATGKKPKPVVVRDLITGEYRKVDGLPRQKDEFYPTPAEATRAGLAAEYEHLRRFAILWEPACGDGAQVREMEAAGFKVYASDLIDRGCPGAKIASFYDYTAGDVPSRAVFTNPPYAECNSAHGDARWLYHGLDTLKLEYMALMLSWSWPGADGLNHFWANHKPARVHLMTWKIDFTGQGAPPMLNAWFVWDVRHQGPTTFHRIGRSADLRQQGLI